MVDENLIGTLEQTLRQTRNAQNRLIARLRDVDSKAEQLREEGEQLREEITALENSAQQTELAIDSLLVSLRSSRRPSTSLPKMRFEDESEKRDDPYRPVTPMLKDPVTDDESQKARNTASISYINQTRGVPLRVSNTEALTNRFSDRTITQACTLLLREAGRPLHVNELYNLLVAGGMTFKGNNPTISIAVSLNRNRRFRKVEPGTFDLVMREAIQAAS
ncbi:MAG: hypothetical protein KF685_10950 [Acidobacteria bacterium]|nr:hypothetical protein [Acidobacteriota bacterium]